MTAISVVMPVRNGERFLTEAMGSVLGQSLRDLELVVVLDHSTDGSAGIAGGLAAGDRRVRVIENAGEGLVDALNAGIAAAGGDLIARLDADDRMREGRLQRQRELLLADPDISLVGSAAIAIDAEGRETGAVRVPAGDAEIRRRLPRGNPFVHSAVMMRRSAVLAAGGYRDLYAHNEDYDLWLRLAGLGRLANIAEPLVDHRRHADAVSVRFAERQRQERRLCRLDWERASGILDESTHRVLRDVLDRSAGRIDALSADPAAWQPADAGLLVEVLSRLSGAEARSVAKVVLAARRAGRLSWPAAARLVFDARLASRSAYERANRAAAAFLMGLPAAAVTGRRG